MEESTASITSPSTLSQPVVNGRYRGRDAARPKRATGTNYGSGNVTDYGFLPIRGQKPNVSANLRRLWSRVVRRSVRRTAKE